MKNEKKTGWYTSEGLYIGDDSESIVAYLESQWLLGSVIIPWCNKTYNSYDMLKEAWGRGEFTLTDEDMLEDFRDYVDCLEGHDLEFEVGGVYTWRGRK